MIWLCAASAEAIAALAVGVGRRLETVWKVLQFAVEGLLLQVFPSVIALVLLLLPSARSKGGLCWLS